MSNGTPVTGSTPTTMPTSRAMENSSRVTAPRIRAPTMRTTLTSSPIQPLPAIKARIFAMLGVTSPELIHGVSFVVAFSVISFLHIVVGELAPKTLAIRNPEIIGLWSSIPLYGFYWAMYPAIWVLNSSANMVLRIAGLNAWYGESHILHGVDFDVHGGEVVTLLGRNGAGKTTTLKAITGTQAASGGEIEFMGRSIRGQGPWHLVEQGLVMVPEGRGVFARQAPGHSRGDGYGRIG